VHVAVGGGGSAAVGAAVRREARALLGLDAPLAEFYRHVADDPVLGPFTRPAGGLVGLRPSHAADLFEMLVGAISAQQINLPFAFATRSRLVRRLGSPVAWSGVTVYGFPTPERVAQASMATLRRLQFSTRKAEYIVGLARAIADGRLDLEALREAPDEAVIGRLTAQRGLGRWTAEWFLARGLGRPDICPADDLGVRRAMEALCFGGRPATPADVRRRMAVWRPYRSLAVHYLLAGFRQRATAPAGRLPAATAGGRR
jgi:DNA-3-methyladenine glycosylase II